MRFSTTAILPTLASLAIAQSLYPGLPKCAQDCFGTNFGSCGLADFKCICANSTLISNLSCCVFSNCTASDQKITIDTAVGLCKANQIDVPTSASCASTPTPTASSSSSAAAATTSSSTGVAAPIVTAGIKAGAGIGFAMGMAGLFAAL